MRHVIAVVDSDDAVMQLMGELLDIEGYVTHAFHSQYVSAADIQHVHPDLVIIEVSHTQPATTLNFLTQLRHSTGSSSTPIIINSTSWQVLEMLHDPLNQLDCFLLEKPFDVDQFLDCVSYAMKPHVLTFQTNPCVVSI